MVKDRGLVGTDGPSSGVLHLPGMAGKVNLRIRSHQAIWGRHSKQRKLYILICQLKIFLAQNGSAPIWIGCSRDLAQKLIATLAAMASDDSRLALSVKFFKVFLPTKRSRTPIVPPPPHFT